MAADYRLDNNNLDRLADGPDAQMKMSLTVFIDVPQSHYQGAVEETVRRELQGYEVRVVRSTRHGVAASVESPLHSLATLETDRINLRGCDLFIGQPNADDHDAIARMMMAYVLKLPVVAIDSDRNATSCARAIVRANDFRDQLEDPVIGVAFERIRKAIAKVAWKPAVVAISQVG